MAFKAKYPHFSYNSYDNVIVFETAQDNYGDGYNTSTGIFTAPVAGLYLFSAQVCPSENDNLRFEIMKGGSELLYGTAYDYYGRDCTSATTFARLEVGEEVWMTLRSNALADSEANYFSGVLIHY